MHALTITVTDPRINGSAPTNIPLIVPGQVGQEILWRRGPMSQTQYEIAVKHAMDALQRGESLPWFASIDEAVKQAKAASNQARMAREDVGVQPSMQPGLRPMLDVPPSVTTLSPEAVRPLPPDPGEHEPVQFSDTMLAQGPPSTRLFGDTGMKGDPSLAVQAMEWFKRRGIPDDSGEVPPGIPGTQDRLGHASRNPETGFVNTLTPDVHEVSGEASPPGLIPLKDALPMIFGRPR